MRRLADVRCLWAAAACVALLAPPALADDGDPRALVPPATPTSLAATPLEAPLALSNSATGVASYNAASNLNAELQPRSYDDFLYGTAAEPSPVPMADGGAESSWTSALDRFSL